MAHYVVKGAVGCTKNTFLSSNFLKPGHYVWLGINKGHAKYLRKMSIPYARARAFCILHVNACSFSPEFRGFLLAAIYIPFEIQCSPYRNRVLRVR